MKFQTIDKFEYKYEELSSSIHKAIIKLNELGKEGWELIKIENPTSYVGYKALLKRRITEYDNL